MKNIIAIDFDDTILFNKHITIDTKEKVNELFENPENFIVIYTSRSYSCFEYIRETLNSHLIKYHAIICEKTRADIYIDDMNAGGLKWN